MTIKGSIKGRISDWQRFQTIISVLAKYGFSGIIHDLGLSSSKSKSKLDEDGLSEKSIPTQLRLAFEELGPTFIKLGQLLSTRPDLLPENYISEFSKLTDSITPFSYDEITRILQIEFGRDPLDIFAEIETRPLAAASIAQVHRARLKETDEKIVLKIQRPGIAKTIQNDIQVLYFIARGLEKIREEFRLFNLSSMVKEFQRSIYEELDFTLEAKNIDQFRENFPNLEGICLPVVHWDFTTKKVLAMSELEGISLSKIEEFPASVDRAFLAEAVVTFFLESMFFHGLFHADAHPGNILLITEGRGKLGLLDFGMVGTLGPELRRKLSKLFMAIVARDFENLALLYTEVGEFGRSFSIRDFQTDVKDFLQPHLGKPISQVNVGELLLNSAKIARKYHVKLPRDLIFFYRSLITLEAVGRKLDPAFDFLNYGKKFGHSLLRQRFSSDELLRDLYRGFEGLRSLTTEFPIQVKGILERIERNSSPENSKQNQKIFIRISRQIGIGFLVFSFFLSATLISAFKPNHSLEWPLWIISGILAVIELIIILI